MTGFDPSHPRHRKGGLLSVASLKANWWPSLPWQSRLATGAQTGLNQVGQVPPETSGIINSIPPTPGYSKTC